MLTKEEISLRTDIAVQFKTEYNSWHIPSAIDEEDSTNSEGNVNNSKGQRSDFKEDNPPSSSHLVPRIRSVVYHRDIDCQSSI